SLSEPPACWADRQRARAARPGGAGRRHGPAAQADGAGRAPSSVAAFCAPPDRAANNLWGFPFHIPMPLPYPGRMQDAEIVEAVLAGQEAGPAAAYDRYAASLYGYCRSLLGEPADAAAAAQDTFIVAAGGLGGLRDPARLRPWLYAVARNECHRRLRTRASSAPLHGVGQAVGVRPAPPPADPTAH